jgi:hypothetical protein
MLSIMPLVINDDWRRALEVTEATEATEANYPERET